MFFEIDILTKLYKLEDEDQINDFYANYIEGIMTIVMQYLEDQTYLSKLPPEKLTEIGNTIEKIEDPNKIIEYLYGQIPEKDREGFQKALDGALERYHQKILNKGLSEMSNEEIQEFQKFLDENKTMYKDVIKDIEAGALEIPEPETPPVQPENTPAPEPVASEPEVKPIDTQPVPESEPVQMPTVTGTPEPPATRQASTATGQTAEPVIETPNLETQSQPVQPPAEPKTQLPNTPDEPPIPQIPAQPNISGQTEQSQEKNSQPNVNLSNV